MRRSRTVNLGAGALVLLALVASASGQWESERRVTSNTGTQDATCAGNAKGVALVGNTVHVVYHEGGALSTHVFYRRSTDGGANWSSPTQLSGGSVFPSALFGCVVAGGNNVYAAWGEFNMGTLAYQIKFSRSTDAGSSWGSATTISTGGTLNEVPALALSGTTLHAAWDDGGAALHYRRSTNGGGSWQSVQTIATSAATGSVAADGNTVLVSYSVGSGSAWDIYLRRSTDGGVNFGSAQAIETPSGNADISTLAVRGSAACIAWYDNGSGNYDVWSKRSTDGGASWGADVAVASGSGSQEAPGLAVGANGVFHACYEDNSYGNYEIAHRYSTDGGASWSTATRLTNAGGTSQRPSTVTLGADTVGVLWTDGRDSETNTDVFFRRGRVALESHDVGAFVVLAPTGTVDSTASVAPACSVRNYGNQAESYRVRCRVGGFYSDTARVTGHAAGTSRLVTFPALGAWPRGNWTVVCSTELATDQAPANDSARGSVLVRVLDARPLAIIAPAGSVDSGATIAPRVRVRNDGNTTVSFDVGLQIGATALSQSVSGLGAGAEQDVTFSDWVAGTRGTWPVRCTTRLTGDMLEPNNLLADSVTVLVHDYACTAVLAPLDTVEPGPVAPVARARNNGSLREPATVVFTIDATPAYAESIVLAAGLPFADTTLAFPAWTAVVGGYTATCRTALATDQLRANDTSRATFTVAERPGDVGVTAIIRPAGKARPDTTIIPAARVENYGSHAWTFTPWFAIRRGATEVYREALDPVQLAAGADTVLGFPGWYSGTEVTDCVARCSLVTNDDRFDNDTMSLAFFVAPPAWSYGWHEVAPMPAAPSGKPVKRGGWLAAGPGRLVYAAKGNRTGDFYRYDAISDTWTTLTPIPDGPEGRPAEKGCRGISDGEGSVYVVKGNNTLAFWLYDITTGGWLPLADVPAGPSGKKVKGGGDLEYVVIGDTGWVYLLKGYRTEFWRYNTVSGEWQARADAPVGIKGKWDKDSWLAFDGDRTMYAHKAKYYSGSEHEFWCYDIAGDSWSDTRLAGLPLYGLHSGRIKRKKAKDGGAGAYYNGEVYGLKGGNTQQFFRYDVAGDSWSESDTMPTYGSTGKKKRVKAGGDLVHWGFGYYFALKGNKTLELWRYASGGTVAPPPARGGVAGNGKAPIAGGRMQLGPNPARGYATLRLVLPKAGPATVRVFDALGREVLGRSINRGLETAPTSGVVSLDLRGLSAGVYLVKMDADGFTGTQKLVIQH